MLANGLHAAKRCLFPLSLPVLVSLAALGACDDAGDRIHDPAAGGKDASSPGGEGALAPGGGSSSRGMGANDASRAGVPSESGAPSTQPDGGSGVGGEAGVGGEPSLGGAPSSSTVGSAGDTSMGGTVTSAGGVGGQITLGGNGGTVAGLGGSAGSTGLGGSAGSTGLGGSAGSAGSGGSGGSAAQPEPERLTLCARLLQTLVLSNGFSVTFDGAVFKDKCVGWTTELYKAEHARSTYLSELSAWNLKLWGCQDAGATGFAPVWGTPETLTSGDAVRLVAYYVAALNAQLAAMSQERLSPTEEAAMREALARLSQSVITDSTTEFSHADCLNSSGTGGSGGSASTSAREGSD